MPIHRTAVVSPSAEIADDVEIGSYVCINGHAVIGRGCVIQAHAILAGDVFMGKNNTIGYGAVIGADPQDQTFDPHIHSKVIIGDDNRIREYCTIHRGSTEGSATRVGDHNYFMAGTHLGHDTVVGNHVEVGNNVLFGGHVQVNDKSYIGGGGVFHQHVRIGRHAFTQGQSTYTKDVPPFTLAAIHNGVIGINVLGLRHAGFTQEERTEIKRAFNLVYKSGLNITQAITRANGMEWADDSRAFFDFISAAKKRGVCDMRRLRQSNSRMESVPEE